MISKTHIATIAGIALFPVTAASLIGAQVFAAETTTSTATSASSTPQKLEPPMDQRGMNHGGGPRMELTDTEKTTLESMTDIEKKAFFDKKMTEQRAKMDAREAVIDKLLNGESLSDADKVIVTQIKAERAKMKEERAKMDTIRTKLQNNETLTADEQAIIDAHKKGPKGSNKGGDRGQKSTSQTTVSQ